MSRHFPAAELLSPYWGDDHGAGLDCGGVSIPGYDGTRAGTGDALAVAPTDQETAEWQLLLVDPLCELRVLAALGAESGELAMPGVQAAGEEIADRLRALTPQPSAEEELGKLLRETALADAYPDALRTVAQSEELADACAGATDMAAAREVAVAAARAVMAQLLAECAESAWCTGAERDRLVGMLLGCLGGTGRVPGGRAARALLGLALRVTAQPALDHWRGRLTTGSVPALGDILRYQARGGPLRADLLSHITADPRPTVVIGHSLGGIALVDLLAMSAENPELLGGIKLLVTVGSQAPFLHELGALTGLPPNAALPAGFPPWLNIYDSKDLLAYRAQPVFPDAVHVSDHEVNTRQPFPVCHSAYWKLDAVYERIADEIEALG
ncbi:hypothetical protein ACTWQF_07480 [Streptomyces sp. 8N114]|uniref:hypothetical protein n=1 Tax=Streptomyces sp. 8N114 TaxID=3457419 RepID=UPI003FD4E2ED